MLQQLINFFTSIFGGRVGNNVYLITFYVFDNGSWIQKTTADLKITLFGIDMPFGTYLSLICSYISLIFIVVLCCLFVYKIIKLIGGLIR